MTHTPAASTHDFPAQKIEAAHRQTTMITGAIAATLLIYVIVVEVLKRTVPAPANPPALDTIRITLFIMVGAVIFLTTVIKSMLLRRPAATGEARLAQLRTAGIMTAAFAEMPAVLGLVLFLMGRRPADFYLLLVVAAYMLARHFPRRDSWENYVRRGGNVR